ncbi:MerR family transcriptional regulator [Streptomyces melanosporofaciens]|uniref:DNA-binding transcriptional regulator, MerR family n=1 Tax=Streptomyces melanosporofaciens TaxID=67327 RepID=A0A1H5B893_STRMJ|nr:MerR family transcriptional regulator [Streptomyces melanosporofaciens]SED50617.1 DNA-binding transcriptional regulator, MerR family [Streptomyces melanosporofaciens]
MTTTGTEVRGSPMTIQQVSRLSGLSEPTLRYYEKIGLIPAVDRDRDSGHRRYHPTVVETIKALGCLRSTGMSVQDMRAYLRHLDEGAQGAAPLRDLFRRNAERLEREMALMAVRLRYLRLKAEMWDARERADADAERRAIDEITGVIDAL